MSQRDYDINGYVEIKRNPLSKVGVFPYLGSSIGAPDPQKVYMVYRPEEELADLECVESFKLMPLVDDHTMLGPSDMGFTPAECKGVHGVIGEEVFFDGGYLYGNLKIFSDSLQDKVDNDGKKDLSAGYRCKYEFTQGFWNGQHYDAVQRQIRGNHIALVQEGRMGPEVSVLDHLQVTFDTKEILMEEEAKKADAQPEMTLSEVAALLKQVLPQIAALNDAVSAMKGGAAEPDADNIPSEDAEQEEKKDYANKEAGMDAAIKTLSSKVAAFEQNGVKSSMAEVSKRDALALKLSHHVGTFDASEMTVEEVAQYGVKKLGIAAMKGQEASALAGFLHNREVPSQKFGLGMDGASNKADAAIDAVFKK